MTPDEVFDLLTFCAVFDQRTVGEADVEGWLFVAELEGWTWPLAHRAVVEHYRAGADKRRITPAHISDQIRHVRVLARRATLHQPIDPPRELCDKPRAEIAWRRSYAPAVVHRAVAEWAATGELPAVEPVVIDPKPDYVPQRIQALIGPAFRLPSDIRSTRQ